MDEIHLKHYKDGYPLCWPMDKSGVFKGSFKDEEVTCPSCLTYIEEFSRGIVSASSKSG